MLRALVRWRGLIQYIDYKPHAAVVFLGRE